MAIEKASIMHATVGFLDRIPDGRTKTGCALLGAFLGFLENFVKDGDDTSVGWPSSRLPIVNIITRSVDLPDADAASSSDPNFRHHVGRADVSVSPALISLIRSLQQICASIVAEALAEAELVQLEYALMALVNDVPGISQQALSEPMGVDRTNVGVITDKLEARGLLRRSVNADVAAPISSI